MNENCYVYSQVSIHQTALSGREHFQGSDWTVRKLPGKLVLRRTQSVSQPKQKTLQLNKKQEELSSIAAISLFTVKESTMLTSSIKN